MAVGGDRPNIFLIVLDTLSARAAGLDRASPPMPNLASLAERGLRFGHAVSNAPWTYPAHASLFTGLLPSEHGMDTPYQFLAWERDDPSGRGLTSLLPAGPASDPELGERWLPSLLARAGYETALLSNNPWVSRITGMHHGFHRMRDPLAFPFPRWRSALRSWRRVRPLARAAYNASRASLGMGDMLAADAVRFVRAWVESRDADRPLFLFVNLIEAHAPYLTPRAPEALRRAHAGPPAVFRAMRLTELRQAIPYNLGGLDPVGVEGPVGILRRLHEAAARYLDSVLSDLLRLPSAGHRRTVFCLTSDHGESFGERGALLHGFTMHEQALHIPLVLSGGELPAEERDETVDLRRIHATLLEVAGLRAPDASGPSLLRRDGGVAVAERERVEVPRWASRSWSLRRARAGRLRAVYRDPWKLVQTEAGTALYDLSTDPGERVDQSSEQPGLVHELMSSLPSWAEGGRGRRPARETSLSPREEEEMAERLAAMGYLE